jgi:hypothetical protein
VWHRVLLDTNEASRRSLSTLGCRSRGTDKHIESSSARGGRSPSLPVVIHNSLRPHPHPLPMKPSRRPLSVGTPIFRRIRPLATMPFRRPRQVRTPFFRRPSATGDLHCAYPCASTAPPAADTDLVDVVTSLNLGNQENSTGLCKKRKKIQSCSPPSRKEWHGPTIPVRLESICFTSSKCS